MMRKDRDRARRIAWFDEQMDAYTERTGNHLLDPETISVWINELGYNEAWARQKRWLNRLVALAVVLVLACVLVVVVRG